MKLTNIFENAARLCGMAEDYYKNNDSSELSARALTAINTVLFDLCEEEKHESLLEEVPLSGAVFDAAVYGTAMYLSLAFGDTDKASFFSGVYGGKRAGVKSKSAAIADRLPKTEANR
ncbi:MAG: hypothetical protein J6T73_04075 [Clostridia bacterium]|nr:hypothetical protein [Clostridia bacterium]